MKRYFIILFNLFICVFTAKSQGLTLQGITDLKNGYTDRYPWEEIYIHADREKLIAGEDLWLSIFSTDRSTGKLSERSSIAYVELINPWNVPIIQKRLLLTGGRGEGSFLLPDSISSGEYTIRAYTNWMKNFFPVNCYKTVISVFNPFRNSGFRRLTEIKDPAVNSVDMKFYPEGGNFLHGIETKVIVRCVDRFGKGVALSGSISDNSGKQITDFKTDGWGFGTVMIVPETGEKYSVKTNSGTFYLPEVKENGLAVSVDNTKADALEVTISASGSYVLPSSRKYYFIIETNGNINVISEIKLSDIFTKILVPRIKLPGGVSQIALIGEDRKVMFGRLIYTPVKAWDPSYITMDSVSGRREKFSLDLGRLKDQLTGISDISISVTPSAVTPSVGINEYMEFGTVFGSLPWTGSGKTISGISRELIDNFLISTKDHWIDWEKILSGNLHLPKYQAEKENHFLNVSLRYRNPEQVDSVDFLYMAIQGKYAEFKYARRDTNGTYVFMLPVDNVQRKLIIQPAISSGNIILEIEPSYLLSFPATHTNKDDLSQQQVNEFSGLSFNYQASRIYSSVYKKERPAEIIQSIRKPRFYGIPEIELIMDDYIKLPVMQEVFFELIPGVTLRSRKTGYDIRIINPFSGLFYDEPPLIMIDGMILNDINILAEFDPELVERVEVVKTPYLIGDLILNGIVNVITRAGTYSNVVIPEYAAQLPYTVVEKSPVFAAPDYSDPELKRGRVPDLRNTIYWNPYFKTSPDSKDTVDFWTSDQAGDYVIDIEGISASGEKISIRKSFTVK